MTQCLFVIIGAGASFASTSAENIERTGIGRTEGALRAISLKDLRPPLVTELFDPRFAGILDKYPVAQMAASDIRKQTKTPVAIEEYLRDRYRDSDDELDQRKFHAVHWYLQDLLWTVSKYYTTHPDNYDRLISSCLRLRRVVFITLNYDTLLDDRLRIVSPIDSMDAYVVPDRRWSLVKPHGSVDWGIPIETPDPGPYLISNPPPKISVDRTDIRLRRPRAKTIDDVRRQGTDTPEYFYPAMSVPVGTRDEFSCPDVHVGHVRNMIQAHDQLDVLMLGYSALDEEILTLFKDSGRPLNSLGVVNADKDSATAAYQRVQQALGIPRQAQIYPNAFGDFVGTDDLDRYLEAL